MKLMKPDLGRGRPGRLFGKIRRRADQGQIMILTGLVAIIMFGIIGLSVDVGRMFAARAELGRAVDAAALAGVLEFPSTTNAQAKAQSYLQANEPTIPTSCGSPGMCTSFDTANNKLTINATKQVKFFFLPVLGITQVNVKAHAAAGFGIAPVDAYIALDATGSMSGTPISDAKNAATIFAQTLLTSGTNSGYTLVGVGEFRGCYNPPIGNPQTGSVNPAYLPTPLPQATPINLQIAFTSYTVPDGSGPKESDMLATKTPTPTPVTPTKTPTPVTPTKTPTPVPPTATNTPIPPTATPTRTPTPIYGATNLCVRVSPAPTPQVLPLQSDLSAITSDITNMTAVGGTGTNICLGLLQGKSVLAASPHLGDPKLRSFLILLSDGDNTYNNYSYSSWQNAPAAACRPVINDPSQSDGNVSSSCSTAQVREMELDNDTKAVADQIKATGAEIYIVGYGVCGTNSTTTYCDASKIGNLSYDDNTADRNLLKCLASSTSGTNDHYYETSDSSQLQSIFSAIAHQIGHRLLE